jgi:type II secretory pathway predicted ATPase ExeA
MLESHFGLSRRPFPSSPDHASYYPATGHEQALQSLLAGLDDGEGVMVLTGGPGTGKTLLCQCLLDRAGPDVTAAFLTHTHMPDRAGLLQAILYDLSLPYEGLSEQGLRLALVDHLVSRFEEGKRTLLVIDEAHHLGVDLLEELRLLGNLEGNAGKAMQVVLVGQPELLETLASPRLSSLRQRLVVRPTLEPMGVEEAADYVLHHLRAAGGAADDIIDGETLELIARLTGGVPRLLNQVMHHALRLSASMECPSVELECVLEALAAFGLAEPELAEAPAEPTFETPRPTPASPVCRLFVAPARSA